LGGSDVPKPALVMDAALPEPPPRESNVQSIARGAILYNRFCSRCHIFGRGELPDLRRLSPATHSIFYDIVLSGAYAPKGMGRFDDVLSSAEAHQIHAFLVDQAWQAHTVQQRGSQAH
jgi:quinohemoprotein ethanol dehydrogenase